MGNILFENRETELLAPAGSYEGFEAALGAGADAVYAGGSLFGARAYAANFVEEELVRAIRVSHIHGKKFYLTVNTLLKNPEISGRLYEFLLPCYEAGLDGVIVQDLGVLRFIRRNFPGLNIHASTQMTVTGPRGMKFLEEQGVTRVVPARELSLEEIGAMHRASPLEIETFIHGALCYSFSGRCLMSSLLGGRSGNRGRCAQPCRLPGQVTDGSGTCRGGKDFCPLSLKDLCTLSLLPEILGAGVTSLKIEGRMKQPAYTAGVTAVYRKYLDLLLERGPEHYRVDPEDERRLLEVFSRGGSCSGYYHRHNGREMMDFANEKKRGEPAVEIRKRKEKIYGKLILFPGSPAILELSCRDASVRAEAGEVQQALNRPMTEERVRSQMDRLGNTEFVWEKLDILMGEDLFVPVKTLNDLRREGLEMLEAKLTGQEDAESGTGSEEVPGAEDLSVRMPGFQEDTAVSTPAGCPEDYPEDPASKAPESKALVKTPASSRQNVRASFPLPMYVSCETFPQAEALKSEEGIRGMYLPWDVTERLMETDLPQKKELYLALPQIVRRSIPRDFSSRIGAWMKKGMKGFLVRDLEGFALVRDLGYGSRCVLDSSLYTWNEEASAFWREEGILRDTVPVELNEKELRHRGNGNSELILYGYLPLMITAQCLQKNAFGCSGKESRVWLKDRYQKEFPCVCCCRPWKEKTTDGQEDCYNMMYNSLPFSLLREKPQVEGLGLHSLRLSFTLEAPGEARRILKEFLRVYGPASGKETGSREISFPEREVTKGHFKRGVR